MLMDVLELTSPSDLGAVLDQFKAFALARGWTLDGDSSSVFQLRSSGFGNQPLIFRFQGLYTGANAYYGLMNVIGVSPLTPAFSTSMTAGAFTGTGAYAQISIRGAGAHNAWIVGNSRILGLVHQNNEYSCTSFLAGSFDLFETSRNDGFFAAHSRYSNGAYNWDSVNVSEYRYFTHPGANLHLATPNSSWLAGAGGNYGTVKMNLINPYIDQAVGAFDDLSDVLKTGCGMAYSGGRLLLQPTVYRYDATYSLWRPLGRMPFFFLRSSGLKPGDLMDYGGERYRFFPYMYMPHPYGWAVRVA